MKWGSITQMICPMCGTLESVNTEQATVTPTAESCVTSEPYACGDCRIGTDKNRIGSSCRMCRNASPIFKKPPHRSKPPPMTKKSKTKTVKLSPGFVRYHHPVAVGRASKYQKYTLCHSRSTPKQRKGARRHRTWRALKRGRTLQHGRPITVGGTRLWLRHRLLPRHRLLTRLEP